MDGRRNVVNVTRDDVLDGARRGFRRTKFNDNCVLSVKFSGEARIDDGEPSREILASPSFQPVYVYNEDLVGRYCVVKYDGKGYSGLIEDADELTQ